MIKSIIMIRDDADDDMGFSEMLLHASNECVGGGEEVQYVSFRVEYNFLIGRLVSHHSFLGRVSHHPRPQYYREQ